MKWPVSRTFPAPDRTSSAGTNPVDSRAAPEILTRFPIITFWMELISIWNAIFDSFPRFPSLPAGSLFSHKTRMPGFPPCRAYQPPWNVKV